MDLAFKSNFINFINSFLIAQCHILLHSVNLVESRGDFVIQTSTVGLKILIENSTLELESSQGYPERMPVLVGYY